MAAEVHFKNANRGKDQSRTNSGAVFQGWMGEWKFERQIENRHTESMSGRVLGKAHFRQNRSLQACRYSESGILQVENGATIEVYRHYIYEYDLGADKISSYFVGGTRGGLLFHDFSVVANNQLINLAHATLINGPAWGAHASHCCGDDQYAAWYYFLLPDLWVQRMEIIHQVSGPGKNYISRTFYSR